MVALEESAQATARARQVGRSRTTGWLVVGTAAVLLVGALAPLAIAPGVGRLSASVMTLLLGASAAGAGLALGSPRLACGLAAGLVVLLSLGRLAPRPGPGYEEPEALWQTDQRISLALPAQSASTLAVLAQPVFTGSGSGAEAPFGLTATLNGSRSLNWRCAFVPGLQWLELPVEAGLSGGAEVDARLGLTGSPDHQQAYLLVYHSTRHDGYLIGWQLDPSVSAPLTTCTAT